MKECGHGDLQAQLARIRSSTHLNQENLWLYGFFGSSSGGEEPERKSLQQIQHEDPDEVDSILACLRMCTSLKDISRGAILHEYISRKNFYRQCSDALIKMYAKCGALTKAKELFDNFKSMDPSTWTAIIAGYVHERKAKDALYQFHRMQLAGLCSTAATLACVLKACGIVRAIEIGETLYDQIIKQGLLKANVKLGTALVSMYSKCGLLKEAHYVLEELSLRDVALWNALIGGYVDTGESYQANYCLEKMQRDGFSPDAVTFSYILKLCGDTADLNKGKIIHEEIAKEGLLENDIPLGNALVDMYAKCCDFAKALQVLEQLPIRDVITWNSLIAAYANVGQGKQALDCFEKLQHEGLFPDVVTFACILKACGSIGAIHEGTHIHDEISKQGLLNDHVAIGTNLIDMYASCGAFARAQEVLQELPFQNVGSWNALLDGYVAYGEGEKALKCFEQMQYKWVSPDATSFVSILKAFTLTKVVDRAYKIHNEIIKRGLLEDEIILGTALVDLYAKYGTLSEARCVFDHLVIRDVISWNALIAGYAENGEGEEAWSCFQQMQYQGFPPDAITLSCILRACGTMKALFKGEKVHKDIVKQGLLENDCVLGTNLIDMYIKCGDLTKAGQMLEELHSQDVVCWNTLIAGLAESAKGAQAIQFFEQMQQNGLRPDASSYACILGVCGTIGALAKGEKIHNEITRCGILENNLVLGTALAGMYSSCGALTKAQEVAEKLCAHDVVLWNVLITRFVECGEGGHALDCFERMQLEGLSPDEVTFSSALKACSITGAVLKGREIHDEVCKQGLLKDNLALGTVLVEMYSSCGDLEKAQVVFEELPVQDVISWNVFLAGLRQHGEGAKALSYLEQMQWEGFLPNAATFSCVLSACSRSSLLTHASNCFSNMYAQHGVKPDVELYTCMVDMYGRAGHLDKAKRMIEKMNCFDNGACSALLNACQKWGSVTAAEWAFDYVKQLGK